MSLFFHSEKRSFKFEEQQLFENWIKRIVEIQSKSLGPVNIVFTSNEQLLKINQDYLKHNYYTDVITFNYNTGNQVSGDIFVSVDQVVINSKELKIDFLIELSRVIIHGILHLLDYNDSNEEEVKEIRMMEDKALAILEGMRDG